MFARNKKILGILLLLVNVSCKEVIIHDLDELRANQIKLILENNEIATSKEQLGTLWQISVSIEDTKKALGVIEKSRILSRDLSHFKEQSKSILQSKEEKNQIREKEISWGLEQTLEGYLGVLEARVHLNLQITPNFPNNTTPLQSAAILLIVKEKAEIKETEIKQIISGASGISPEKISVIISEQKPIPITKENKVKNDRYQVVWIFLITGPFFIASIIIFINRKRRKQKVKISEEIVRPLEEEDVLVANNLPGDIF